MSQSESQIEEIEAEYRETLRDLQENNKAMINVLTMLANEKAEECAGAAQAIVRVIESHLNQVPPHLKLFVLYLIDSIVKNCTDKPYKKLFAENLLRTFVGMFRAVDEKTRAAMHRVRLTWNDYFVPSKLHAIDVKVAEIDPAWPVQQYGGGPEGPPDLRGEAGITGPTPDPPTSQQQTVIHVNPKFLGNQIPVNREEMARRRKQEMLRVQHERNEREMIRRKRELEQQNRMRGMTEKKMDGRVAKLSKQPSGPTVATALTTEPQDTQPPGSVGPSARHKTPKGRIREMYEREAMDQNAGDSGSEAAPPSGSGTPVHEPDTTTSEPSVEKAPTETSKAQAPPTAEETARLPIKKRRHIETESEAPQTGSPRTSAEPDPSADVGGAPPPPKRKTPQREGSATSQDERRRSNSRSRSREPGPEDVSVLYQGVSVHSKPSRADRGHKENERERFSRRDRGDPRDRGFSDHRGRGHMRPQFRGGRPNQRQWEGYKSNRPFRISQFAHYMDERAREIDGGPQSIFPQNQDGGVRIGDFDPGQAERLINMATHRLHQGEISQAAYEDIVKGLEQLASSSGQNRRGPPVGRGGWMPLDGHLGPPGGPRGPPGPRPRFGPMDGPMRPQEPGFGRETPPPLFPPRGGSVAPRGSFLMEPRRVDDIDLGPGLVAPEEPPRSAAGPGPFPVGPRPPVSFGPNVPQLIPPVSAGGMFVGPAGPPNGAVKQEPQPGGGGMGWMPQFPQNGPVPAGGPPAMMGGPQMGGPPPVGGPPMPPGGGGTPVPGQDTTAGPAAIPPNKHIYVDGRAYEVQYVGDVAVIERSGLPHRIHFVGPPRDVVIDGVAYTLAFGERRSVTIDGQRHVMMFGGPSRELYLGSQPLRGSFGGPPIHLRINGVEHKIQLSGPPPEVKIEPEPDYENMRHMPSQSRPQYKPANPNQPKPPSTATPTPGVTIQQVADPNKQQTQNAPSAPMNVAELVKKLITSGLIPGAGGQQQTPQQPAVGGSQPSEATPSAASAAAPSLPRTAFTSMNDGPIVRKLKPTRGLQEFNMKDLRIRYSSEIQALYPTAGQQCGMCGQRFDVADLDAYSKHLDWHFHQNRLYQRQQSRPWYIAAEAWVDFKEMDTETREQVKTAMMETWAANRASATTGPYGPEQSGIGGGTDTVIAAEGQDQICDVCCEKLEQFWDEDEEIWKLKNAMQAPDGRIYHPACYQDVSVNDTIRGFRVSALATSNVKVEDSNANAAPEIVDVITHDDDDLIDNHTTSSIVASIASTRNSKSGDGGSTPLHDEREATPLRDE